MKAAVEPLPLVPAMWMTFSLLKSSGYFECQLWWTGPNTIHEFVAQLCVGLPADVCTVVTVDTLPVGCYGRKKTHLISQAPTPAYHLRDGILIHRTSRLADRFHNRCIGLEAVQGLDRRLTLMSVWLTDVLFRAIPPVVREGIL